ncbi:hypothetical protein [Natronorubrum sp. FCH18a]|uniref:hypothetical protein n=1 Tax=Natronorubrum sp. FCH18a TaxID=3447018 RepID=UPI003F516C55
MSPLAYAVFGTFLIVVVGLVIWRSSPDNEETNIRTNVYADTLGEKIVHSFDSIIREQYAEPATVHIQWADSSTRHEKHTETDVDGIILDVENWLRLDIADGEGSESTFQEVDLDDVWLVWIDDYDGKRALHFASDEAHDEWRREHPESAYQDLFDTNRGQNV